MFFVLLELLFTIGYASLFYFLIDLSSWYLFLWIPLGFILGLVSLVIFIYLFLFFGSITKNKSGRFRHFILRNAVWIAMKVFHVKLVIENKEYIPQNETYVVYSNHKSNMDPMFIYYAIHHRKITAVGKKTLFTNHFMNMLGKTFGAISIDRDNDREAAKTMVKAIGDVKRGTSMIIFPEGGIKTREKEEMVNLRAGAYKLAMKPGVKILPVAIIGSSQISKKRRIQKKVIKLIFNQPISKEEYEGLNTTEVGEKVESIINKEILENEK